jgi:hypothetical protein
VGEVVVKLFEQAVQVQLRLIVTQKTSVHLRLALHIRVSIIATLNNSEGFHSTKQITSGYMAMLMIIVTEFSSHRTQHIVTVVAMQYLLRMIFTKLLSCETIYLLLGLNICLNLLFELIFSCRLFSYILPFSVGEN